jgi:transcriptional accessory protein Tex/SPT6
MIKQQSRVTLDDVFAQVEEGKIRNLNLIVKGDLQGSVEAVKQSLEKISNDEVRVKVIHAAAGAINEGDVMLADSANAIIIGFNVRPDTKAKKLAEQSKVDVRSYRIIYELLDDMEAALKGMLAPKLKEVLTGKCEVRQTFNITGVGTIAGCYVTDGKIVRGGKLRDLSAKVKKYGVAKLCEELSVGEPTLRDIIGELEKPGRDVRDSLPAPILRDDIMDLNDLKPDMMLTGTVRNVIDFGAFVDIGVHQDGLVHISEICDRYIRHPSEVLSVGDIVQVRVLSVDVAKKRIALSIKDKKAPKN